MPKCIKAIINFAYAHHNTVESNTSSFKNFQGKFLKLRADFLYGSCLKPNCGPGYNLQMEFKDEFYKRHEIMPRQLKYTTSYKNLTRNLIATHQDLNVLKILIYKLLKLLGSYNYIFYILCFTIIKIVSVKNGCLTFSLHLPL